MKPNTTCKICGYKFYTKQESICTECHINWKLSKINDNIDKIAEAICYFVYSPRRDNK